MKKKVHTVMYSDGKHIFLLIRNSGELKTCIQLLYSISDLSALYCVMCLGDCP